MQAECRAPNLEGVHPKRLLAIPAPGHGDRGEGELLTKTTKECTKEIQHLTMEHRWSQKTELT